MSSAGSLGNPSTGSTVATNINANTNNIDDTSSSSDSDHDRKTGADAGSGKSELSSEASRRPSEISTNSRTNMEGRREVVVAVDAAAPITDTADSCGTTGGRHSGILTHDRQSSIFAGSRASVFSEQQTFPGMVHEDDADVSRNVDEGKSCFACLVCEGRACSQLPRFHRSSATGSAAIFLGASAEKTR